MSYLPPVVVQEGLCLIYVICVCLCIVMSNKYCVVFLFCLSSSCVPYIASFSGLSIFDYPFGIRHDIAEILLKVALSTNQ